MQAQQELRQRVAQIHAAAVLAKLEQLTCPTEQKQALLEALKKSVT